MYNDSKDLYGGERDEAREPRIPTEEIRQEAPQVTAQEAPTTTPQAEAPQEMPREMPQEVVREVTRELPQSMVREAEQEAPQSTAQSAPQETPRSEQSAPAAEAPKKKNRMGLKIAAIALVCALLGGIAGGGVTYFATRSGDKASESASDAPSGMKISERAQTAVRLGERGGALSAADIYEENVGSVVFLSVTKTTGYNFFGQATQGLSRGTGFVITTDGYIATSYHIVKNYTAIEVTTYDGTTYEAQYIGGDEAYDIAVLKIDAQGLKNVTLGDSDKLRVGDDLTTIGNPLGDLTFSMSEGIVSSVNRTITISGKPFNMIQMTCAINPGNSGGPLFNAYGEVVGIVAAKEMWYASDTLEGLAYAIPINDVLAMIQDIMTNGYVSNKPYLGISAGTLTAEMKQQYRYDVDAGVFVYAVDAGGAAEKAGLQMGDVITAIDGNKLASLDDLTAVKKKYAAGDTVTLTVYRQGKTIELKLTWDAAPAEETQAQAQPPQGGQPNGQPNGGQGGNGYVDPNDLFRYFFGGNP
ncbi:MAG: trypsin-like peptidase domain-containing protein [Oscillibacter sp.]|nr:trypsin-like peptidase domain-containing protein [Oscillibacter sp.]